MDALTAVFSWQFLLFSLGVFVLVWVIRTIVEFVLPHADGNTVWEKLVLPLLPPVSGAVVAYFASKYAYPDGLSSLSGRLLFGSVAGMFSGTVYQVAKGVLKDKIQSFANSATNNNTPQPQPVTQVQVEVQQAPTNPVMGQGVR